ncbi:hypothetical protein N7490_008384 [Penicillium lividum]|nr:hypothetical protein N7490_008384 [Penicillium lividum]
MKLTIASAIIAASSALAVPTSKRNGFLAITEFTAVAGPSDPGASMHFVVTDPKYPNDTPTDCNLIWDYGQLPKQTARCNDGEYYIKFPQGAPNFNLFTLELQRVNGSIPEDGRAVLNSNANGGAPGTKWICQDNPQADVDIKCAYNGTLYMSV